MEIRLLSCQMMLRVSDMLPRILIHRSIRPTFVTLNEITLINLP